MGIAKQADREFARGRRLLRTLHAEARRLERRKARGEAWLQAHPPKIRLDQESPERVAWRRMLSSCRNPRSKRYKDNGARAIRVDTRWNDFVPFLLDVGLRPARGFVLTRVNPNEHFTPNNTAWRTTSQQPLRKRPRNSKLTIFNGELRSIPSLAREFGLRYAVLFGRIIRRGQPVQEAIARARHREEACCRCALGKEHSNLADAEEKELTSD
jgi:hypothetical protein